MRIGKRVWLTASLLLVMTLVVSGCASKGIEPLTEIEKEAMVDIALNHPEVMTWMGGLGTYVTEVEWATIGWNDAGKATGWTRLDYEDIADGNLPSDIAYP
ncbi:hypothetical protein ACFLV3_02335 [Chloroflexota bacterium]